MSSSLLHVFTINMVYIHKSCCHNTRDLEPRRGGGGAMSSTTFDTMSRGIKGNPKKGFFNHLEHLRRVWHADRGRLLLRKPGPVLLGLANVLLVETNPFPNLLLFYRTMLFEYPSVLSRFCSLEVVFEIHIILVNPCQFSFKCTLH